MTNTYFTCLVSIEYPGQDNKTETISKAITIPEFPYYQGSSRPDEISWENELYENFLIQFKALEIREYISSHKVQDSIRNRNNKLLYHESIVATIRKVDSIPAIYRKIYKATKVTITVLEETHIVNYIETNIILEDQLSY